MSFDNVNANNVFVWRARWTVLSSFLSHTRKHNVILSVKPNSALLWGIKTITVQQVKCQIQQ